MRAFTELYTALDRTTRTGEKVDALAAYFATADDADAAWALHFLVGGRLKRAVGTRLLRDAAAAAAELPAWMVDQCYGVVGDLAETLALLAPGAAEPLDVPLHRLVEQRLLPMRTMDTTEQAEHLAATWASMDDAQRLVWNKLITGSFRVGVARKLVVRALARVAGAEEAVVAHRLMGAWAPRPERYRALLEEDPGAADLARPYPFFLAHALEGTPEGLGDPEDWQAELKWDGIRAQLIRRQGETVLWSRGEELIGDRFPEVSAAARALPDGTVLDGEILAWAGERPLPFARLQRRIHRRNLTAKVLREAPAVFVAYDLLEHDGVDIRTAPLTERRQHLDTLLTAHGGPVLRTSPRIPFTAWEELTAHREGARAAGAEGLMLKRLAGPYGVGRVTGEWWKWKVDPFSVDAVLVYAQRGSGRRATLYTDYTFAVWDETGELVPFAKAYSGLTDAEIRRVDRWVRRHTVDQHGPVRVVEPGLVFELAFEDIRASDRHRSGLAVRFPRMARWREDKMPADADTLATVRALLRANQPDPARDPARPRAVQTSLLEELE